MPLFSKDPAPIPPFTLSNARTHMSLESVEMAPPERLLFACIIDYATKVGLGFRLQYENICKTNHSVTTPTLQTLVPFRIEWSSAVYSGVAAPLPPSFSSGVYHHGMTPIVPIKV